MYKNKLNYRGGLLETQNPPRHAYHQIAVFCVDSNMQFNWAYSYATFRKCNPGVTTVLVCPSQSVPSTAFSSFNHVVYSYNTTDDFLGPKKMVYGVMQMIQASEYYFFDLDLVHIYPTVITLVGSHADVLCCVEDIQGNTEFGTACFGVDGIYHGMISDYARYFSRTTSLVLSDLAEKKTINTGVMLFDGRVGYEVSRNLDNAERDQWMFAKGTTGEIVGHREQALTQFALLDCKCAVAHVGAEWNFQLVHGSRPPFSAVPIKILHFNGWAAKDGPARKYYAELETKGLLPKV